MAGEGELGGAVSTLSFTLGELAQQAAALETQRLSLLGENRRLAGKLSEAVAAHEAAAAGWDRLVVYWRSEADVARARAASSVRFWWVYSVALLALLITLPLWAGPLGRALAAAKHLVFGG